MANGCFRYSWHLPRRFRFQIGSSRAATYNYLSSKQRNSHHVRGTRQRWTNPNGQNKSGHLRQPQRSNVGKILRFILLPCDAPISDCPSLTLPAEPEGTATGKPCGSRAFGSPKKVAQGVLVVKECFSAYWALRPAFEKTDNKNQKFFQLFQLNPKVL